MSRRQLLMAGAVAGVMFLVFGAIYLEIWAQTNRTRAGWVVTQNLTAGTVLDGTNTKRIEIPQVGDSFAVSGDPRGKRVRLALAAGNLLAPDELVQQDMVLVPLTVHAEPPINAGDTIDVFAVETSPQARTVLVGQNLVVVATGSTLAVLVPADRELGWVSLEAGNAALYVVKTDGTQDPAILKAMDVNAAVGVLSGEGTPQGVATNPTPLPTPIATPAPSPRPTPKA